MDIREAASLPFISKLKFLLQFKTASSYEAQWCQQIDSFLFLHRYTQSSTQCICVSERVENAVKWCISFLKSGHIPKEDWNRYHLPVCTCEKRPQYHI